jgi:surface protein
MLFRFTINAALSSAVVTAAATKDDGNKFLTKDNDGGSMTAAHNPFVPQKLAAVNDINADVDSNGVVQSLRHMFHKESPSALKNQQMTTNSPNNSSPERKDDPDGKKNPIDNTSHDSATVLDSSMDLGILDSNRFPTKKIVRRGLLDCGGDHPVVAADVNFKELVRSCLYNDPVYVDCPYDAELGCWNTSQVTDMSQAFKDVVNFNQPIDSWDTSANTDMSDMFLGAESFNQPINSWKTSAVIDMGSMFWYAKSFNQPVDSWKTSAVTDMGKMFWRAESFNQPVDSWKTSSVQHMSGMFRYAESFNQPVGSWKTSAVTSMSGMFRGAESFNQPIGSWETSAVTDMRWVFFKAESFNQQIDSWNTAAATSMSKMFLGAESFNQCLSTWVDKIGETATLDSMFDESGCPNQGDPNPKIGPWCQGANQTCYASSSGNALSAGRLASAVVFGSLFFLGSIL